ncbi:MAG: thioredoxin [Rikenellaceae bacterium]
MAFEITNANYKELVESGKPVVIDFWAEWCGPCRMISPIIDELYEEYKEQLTIGKCDVDANDEVASTFGIRNIPTILFIKDGKVQEKQIGATTKSNLETKIKNIL